MITITSQLKNFALTDKRVLLRADLNVPIKNNRIINDHRLLSIVPTIDLIHKNGGNVILATHIGRPKGYDPNLSTQVLIPWFAQHGYDIIFESDLDQAYKKSLRASYDILLLENMRFSPGEKTADPIFAQQLAQISDYYINDAFALLHRNDTSITLVPECFPRDKRSIGLLVEKELHMLNKLFDQPKKPFVLIIGGGKVADKLPLLQHMAHKVQTILLCPAIVFTFLKELGKPVGKSLVDDNALKLCKTILLNMKQQKVNILFPLDYQIAHKTFDGPLVHSSIAADRFPDDGVGISIGPKTALLFAQEIKQAQTIFLNGLMGDTRREKTLQGIKSIFTAMADSSGLTVVGGGDSVGAAIMLGFDTKIDHLSTGGGATLAYLSGNELPGLQAFL